MRCPTGSDTAPACERGILTQGIRPVFGKSLLIGSNRFLDFLLVLGASSITAVEINPIITDVVVDRMREQWGGVFEEPEVQLVTEDARQRARLQTTPLEARPARAEAEVIAKRISVHLSALFQADSR